MVIHFDGVIGEINLRNLSDEFYQIVLRHGAIEGLKELSKSFQIAIMINLNQKLCRFIIDFLDKEEIEFDAVY